MKKQLWGKLLKGAIAVSLATSITIPSIIKNENAIYAESASGITQFVDIPASLYAEKHIYRLSLQGIVNGYLDSKTNTYTFKYNNSISREEAVIMAIRFAGLTGELNTNEIVQFPATFTVKNDYKAYIALAFKKGLLDEAEEYKIAEANPKVAWGSTPASREWVTKLIVRTIGQQQLANSLANVEPNFYDKSIIDKKYVSYVNAAVQLGLVKGVTDTTFQPQTAINRASFSTILSRAQKDFPVKHENQFDGILLNKSDSSLTILTNGKEKTVSIDNSTGFYIANNDFAINKSQLVQYGSVSVIAINGVAKFVEMQSTEQNVKTSEYEVLLVNTAKNSITVNDNNSAKEITVDTNTKFSTSEGVDIKLSDLKKNDKIQVLQPTYSATAAPIRIVKVVNGTLTGDTLKGNLLDITDKFIIIETEGETVTKQLAKNPKVKIKNLDNATVSDLLKGTDEVSLTFNDDDQVTGITVDNRNIASYDYAKLVSMSVNDNSITFNKDKITLAAKLTDTTKIYVNGVEIPRNQLANYSSWANISVDFIAVPVDGNLNINDYQVIRLDFHYDITGKLISIDNTNKKVTLELTTGERYAIPYNSIVVEHPTKTNLTVSDLQVGQTYTAMLDTNSFTLNRFILEETVSAKVSYIYTGNGEIVVQYSGLTRTINSKDIKIQKANGQAATISDVTVNSNISLVFRGQEVKTIILP